MAIVDLRASQTGMIIPSGRSSVDGYLLCDGSAVSRTTYSDLFTAIGTTFGAGDGSTTFNIPDLVGAVPRGAGTSTGYTQNVTVTLGAKDNDALQGHWHRNNYGTNALNGGGITIGNIGAGDIVTRDDSTRDAITDTVNGTPRAGNETKMKNVGVNYFIKF